MLRFNDIAEQIESYNPSADLGLLEKAYVFSAKVHQGQVRRSGEPYLIHPLEVAGILAKMKLDMATVATGLLHDTMEDTLTTLEEVREHFGDEIANLVDGVTKISQMSFQTREEQQAENFRKMVLAMVNEAAHCLEEAVVREPRDVDMAMVMGTGFPPFRGGLLRHADTVGIPMVADRLARLADAQGERFRPAPLIQRMVREQRRFFGQ